MEPKAAAEHIEQLRTSMERNFSKSMIELMYHHDFKSHTKAIEILLKVSGSGSQSNLCTKTTGGKS